jgi:hypothetical protein
MSVKATIFPQTPFPYEVQLFSPCSLKLLTIKLLEIDQIYHPPHCNSLFLEYAKIWFLSLSTLPVTCLSSTMTFTHRLWCSCHGDSSSQLVQLLLDLVVIGRGMSLSLSCVSWIALFKDMSSLLRWSGVCGVGECVCVCGVVGGFRTLFCGESSIF